MGPLDAEYEETAYVYVSAKVVCWYEPVQQQGPEHYPWVLVSTTGDGRFRVEAVIPVRSE